MGIHGMVESANITLHMFHNKASNQLILCTNCLWSLQKKAVCDPFRIPDNLEEITTVEKEYSNWLGMKYTGWWVQITPDILVRKSKARDLINSYNTPMDETKADLVKRRLIKCLSEGKSYQVVKKEILE